MLTIKDVMAATTLQEQLLMKVTDLKLSERAQNILRANGIKQLWQLIEMTPRDALNMRYCGRKTVSEINELLSDQGLELGTSLTRELKAALKLPYGQMDPTEFNLDSLQLPPLEELHERIARIKWLCDNYDDVKAGIKAFNWP